MSDLNNIFSSSSCLTQAQLINYIQQKLNTDETYLVESHLNDCPFCSDAIDGLMEADLIQMQEIIKEIKPKLLHNQLKELPTQKVIETPTPLKISSNKNKWMVAASVLLLLGLGGFSVYSFIHNQHLDLAKNEDTKSLPTENTYTETSAPTSTEIVQLSAPEIDKNIDNKVVNSKNVEGIKKEVAKEIVKIAPKVKKEVGAIPMSESKNDTKVEAEPLIETQAYHDNYSQKETKVMDEAVAEKEIALKQKSSSVGLSRKKEAPQVQSNAANQLNYSSNNNSNFDNNFDLNVKNRMSNYENGITCYNKSEYKNAIQFLEIALENSKESEKEDIEYYLAMSYLKTGKNNKAEKLFKKLMDSPKYKPIILEQLNQTKK